MIKRIKILALLLVAATTLMTLNSCEKTIEESQLAGKWQFPAAIGYEDFQGSIMEIKSDHTLSMHVHGFEIGYTWSFGDDHFVATREQSGVKADIDFTVTKIDEKNMTITGNYILHKGSTNTYDISGTLSKVQ